MAFLVFIGFAVEFLLIRFGRTKTSRMVERERN
jgi:hypothetical protein